MAFAPCRLFAEVPAAALWAHRPAGGADGCLLARVEPEVGAQQPERDRLPAPPAAPYRVDPELRCRIDVDDYARSVARGHHAVDCGDRPAAIDRYREARELYAGPLLEDDTSGDWYIGTQRRFHFEHCAVLERLCALLLERGDVDEAVAVGDELLRTDPCRETGHQLLMRAYAALDQPHLIVQQFRQCEATLRRELAVELSEATVELYRALLAGR
jgi:DNA-binding SARP family transcriptional activator